MNLSSCAADEIGKHERGGKAMYMVEKGLCNLGAEFCLFMVRDVFYDLDKERFAAPLSQLPLSRRDALLKIKQTYYLPNENSETSL